MSMKDLFVTSPGQSVGTEFGDRKIKGQAVAKIVDSEFSIVELADDTRGVLKNADGRYADLPLTYDPYDP